MKYLAIIALLIAAATVQAEQFEPPQQIQVDNGVAWIAFSNEVGADLVIVIMKRGDCEIVGNYPIDPNEHQQIISVPPGPPYDEQCLIRPYDRITLLRYRVGYGYIDQLGPYIPRPRVYLPVVKSE